MQEYDVSKWKAPFIKEHTEDCLIIMRDVHKEAQQLLLDGEPFRALRGYIKLSNALAEFCLFDEENYKIHLCRSYVACGIVAIFGLGGAKGKGYAEYALQQAIDIMDSFFRQDINPMSEMKGLYKRTAKLLRELYYNKDVQKLQKKYCPTFPYIHI